MQNGLLQDGDVLVGRGFSRDKKGPDSMGL